jgi:hypothetical protein
LSLADLIPEEKLLATRTTSISEASDNGVAAQPPVKRIQHLSETSDGGSTDSSSNCDVFGEECDVLQEMFPDSSFIEVRIRTLFIEFRQFSKPFVHFQVKHCITIANGDIDRATQLLLHRQENGQSLQATANMQIKKSHVKINDHELKNRIISR